MRYAPLGALGALVLLAAILFFLTSSASAQITSDEVILTAYDGPVNYVMPTISLVASTINLTKAGSGTLAFNIGTLNVTSRDTTMSLDDTTAGTAGTSAGNDGVYKKADIYTMQQHHF